MRPSDIRRGHNVRKFKIEYLTEDVYPEPGKAEPVIIGRQDPGRTCTWRVNRVFYFLGGSSAACLAATAASHSQIVEGTAVAVLSGSFALAKFLLKDIYRQDGTKKKLT